MDDKTVIVPDRARRAAGAGLRRTRGVRATKIRAFRKTTRVDDVTTTEAGEERRAYKSFSGRKRRDVMLNVYNGEREKKKRAIPTSKPPRRRDLAAARRSYATPTKKKTPYPVTARDRTITNCSDDYWSTTFCFVFQASKSTTDKRKRERNGNGVRLGPTRKPPFSDFTITWRN